MTTESHSKTITNKPKDYTRWGKSSFIVVHMENNTIINK